MMAGAVASRAWGWNEDDGMSVAGVVTRRAVTDCAHVCSGDDERERGAAERRARDRSGNSAEKCVRIYTSAWGIPERARNDGDSISGIGADSPVGHSKIKGCFCECPCKTVL
jgi:hypothetical protein